MKNWRSMWGNQVDDYFGFLKANYEEALRRRGTVQGGIYLCELGENVGSEQNSNIEADRPVIVISNNLINSTASNIIVAPCQKH